MRVLCMSLALAMLSAEALANFKVYNSFGEMKEPQHVPDYLGSFGRSDSLRPIPDHVATDKDEYPSEEQLKKYRPAWRRRPLRRFGQWLRSPLKAGRVQKRKRVQAESNAWNQLKSEKSRKTGRTSHSRAGSDDSRVSDSFLASSYSASGNHKIAQRVKTQNAMIQKEKDRRREEAPAREERQRKNVGLFAPISDRTNLPSATSFAKRPVPVYKTYN